MSSHNDSIDSNNRETIRRRAHRIRSILKKQQLWKKRATLASENAQLAIMGDAQQYSPKLSSHSSHKGSAEK